MKTLLLKIPLVRNVVFERGVRREIEAGEYRPSIQPTHILDLGAHKGFATMWFSRQYPDAIIHAYEPNPMIFPVLQRNTAHLKNVTLFCEAVAQQDGTVAFHLYDNYLSSSIFGTGEAISVPSVSLGTAVRRIGGDRIFLKIDIEGAEYGVLKNIPLQIEEVIGEAHPKKAKRNNGELRAALSSFGRVDIGEGTCIFHAV
ncbi:MAG TPA: FkbM family methyltransferase [Candidatus Paceibacterota bacterium]|jgi:FkbM family methyltransferase|nr:FkbM family methyltransferase [Candidatus Paceibacterota bacterium]